MRILRYGLGLASLALLCTLAGCGILGDDEDPPARIVPGESVEGIPLGASKAVAEAVLGEFRTGCCADGLRPWSFAVFFGTGETGSEGLRLGFITEWASGGTWHEGPFDYFWINPPYDGTTREGIGIGSRKALVHAAYGAPDSVHVYDGYSSYFYCFGEGRHFILTFREGLVTRMHIGYYVPLPDFAPICN